MRNYVAVVRRKPDEDLQHFKYIKREKGKNGKWQYYYDKDQLKDDLGFDERARYDKARQDMIREKEQQERHYDWARDMLRDQLEYDIQTGLDTDPSKLKEFEKRTDTAFKFLELQTDSYKRAKRAVDITREKYHNTPIGKLDKTFGEPIRNGKKYIDKLFSRIRKKK